MRRELEHKLEQLTPLLGSEEHWDQAVELLISLEEPALWKAVLAKMDERHLDRRVVGLLARMPADAPGVREKRGCYRSVHLNSNSLVDASLTPNVERISFIRTSFAQGTACPTWFHEFRKLARLKHLELSGGDPDANTLDIPQLDSLRLKQCGVVAIPDLPSLRHLYLDELRGPREIGTYPSLTNLEIVRCRAFVEGALGNFAPFMSSALERVALRYSSVQTVDFFETAIRRGAPLRHVELGSVRRLVSIDGLRNARQLRTFSISGAPLDEIDVLSTMPGLESLALWHTKVKSLEPLRKLSELRQINLTGCEWIVSLAPLKKLPKLEKLVLKGTPFTPDNVPTELRDCAEWPEYEPADYFN